METDPNASVPLITLAACPVENQPAGARRLSGELRIEVSRDSIAFSAYSKAKVEEAFVCSYELNPAYRKTLEAKGLRVTGVSEDGSARIVELPDSRFFVATLFVPQCNSEAGTPHPLIVAYLEAASSRK